MSTNLTSLEDSLAEYTAWANRLAEDNEPSLRHRIDIATQDQLDHQDAMNAREFDRNQGRIARQRGAHQAGVDLERWLKPYQTLVDNNFKPVETEDRFEYLMQVALKLKGTNAGFSGNTGMSNAARIFNLQPGEQKLVVKLIQNAPKVSELEKQMRSAVSENTPDQKFPEPRPATPEEIKRGYVYSKSHQLGNDGMVYYFKDPRGHSNQPTKTVNEGEKDYAYHRAKERHHEKEGDKAMARANSFGAYAHPQGISARKKAEQHYAKADEHRSAWKELGSAPIQEGAMKEVSELYNDWMSSEFAPFDSDSGDDREVIRKAESFLRGQVAPEKIESYAEILADQFHGNPLGNDNNRLSESKRLKILAGILK